MPLAPGTRVGPYEVVALLGAGGMGEVYRARDARLGRDVAIKVLPETVARDPDRLARFEREARAVAALSHPNILSVFDVGTANGTAFVVTELLDGETLRARLAGGPLPVRKAIDIAGQIARGLAAAHDKQIVHRDLKPENVFLLGDGQVKILDFGLARSIADPAGSGATETASALTDPGVVLGTVGYMAPEQVRGQPVDARTDLFALGAVLYELLTGRRAFQRDTAAETMTAILREDPPELATACPGVPPALERIVHHALEKHPAERFQTARDVAFALDAFSGASAGSGSGARLAPASPRRSWLKIAAFPIVAIVALIAGIIVDRAWRPAQTPVTFETKTWDSEWITNARFAPDGRTIVFSAARDGPVPRLYAIRPGTVTSQPIGGPDVHLLAISSKGELAVLTGAKFRGHRLFDGTLARMTMDGAPRPWMEHVREADWSPDGSTLALVRVRDGSDQLEYPIGHVLYEVAHGYLSDLRVSPDNAWIAFFEHPFALDDRGWVKVVDPAGHVRTLAGEYWGEEGLAWAPDSRTVYFSGQGHSELLVPFAVNVSGQPAVRQAFPSAGAMEVQDVAASGRMLAIGDDMEASLRARIPGESAEREFPWLNFALVGFLSRDATSLIFGDESLDAGNDYAVALRDVPSGQVLRLGRGQVLSLSPDDTWAGALVPSTGEMVLYPTGPGDPIRLPKGPIKAYRQVLRWFPDGRRVLVCGVDQRDASRCYTQDIQGGAPTPLPPANAIDSLIAPDGRTMLVKLVTGGYDIVSPGDGLVSAAKGLTGDDFPFAWSDDGRGVIVTADILVPARVDRVDPWTGVRTHVMDMAPPDRTGVNGIVPSQWIRDGRGYVYSYIRELSHLFVATGVGE